MRVATAQITHGRARLASGVRGAALAGLLAIAALVHQATPAEAQLGEWDVKAAFVYNFAKFVEWPTGTFEDSRAPLVIGVLGTDSIGAALDRTVRGRKVNGRVIQVRHGRTLADLGRCHILFVGCSEEGRAGEVLASLGRASTVTMGDMDEFVHSGGIIQIALIQNRIRFAINTARAEQAGIRISSKVLNLCRIVVSRS